MCIDVDKYHKLICQTGDPVILLNITSNAQRLVEVLDLGFRDSESKRGEQKMHPRRPRGQNMEKKNTIVG